MSLSKAQTLNRVVITGMGAITPLGDNIDKTWENLLAGVSGADAVQQLDVSKLQTKIACQIKDYNPADFLNRKLANKLDLVSQYALISAQEALEQSGLLNSTIDRRAIGVIWATGNGGASTYDTSLKDYYLNDQDRKLSPYFVPKVLLDTSSGIISIENGLKGVNYTTVSACASGSTALSDAFNYIRWGKATAIVTGGSDAPICPSLIGGFNSLKALSTANDTPKTASRPFDSERTGFVMGEGGVALVLESLDSALARGATILSEIVGGGINADAYHMTSGHPEGEGAADCMQLALTEANISFDQLDYINAHATSTSVGDLAESKAIAKFLDRHTSPYIGATKSMTGHLMGAAGALEGAICALTTQHNLIPPTINLDTIDPALHPKLNFVGSEVISTEVNYALSNSFGFGGHNSCVIFKKYRS